MKSKKEQSWNFTLAYFPYASENISGKQNFLYDCIYGLGNNVNSQLQHFGEWAPIFCDVKHLLGLPVLEKHFKKNNFLKKKQGNHLKKFQNWRVFILCGNIFTGTRGRAIYPQTAVNVNIVYTCRPQGAYKIWRLSCGQNSLSGCLAASWTGGKVHKFISLFRTDSWYNIFNICLLLLFGILAH